MSAWKVVFRVHATQRMFQRRVSPDTVRRVLETGEVIENYPDDEPYPSCLINGCVEGRPIHLVMADNAEDGEKIVITVYEPDPERWDHEFRKRRPS